MELIEEKEEEDSLVVLVSWRKAKGRAGVILVLVFYTNTRTSMAVDNPHHSRERELSTISGRNVS